MGHDGAFQAALLERGAQHGRGELADAVGFHGDARQVEALDHVADLPHLPAGDGLAVLGELGDLAGDCVHVVEVARSEEHTSELQSLMRISYAVFCLHKKKTNFLTPAQYKLR